MSEKKVVKNWKWFIGQWTIQRTATRFQAVTQKNFVHIYEKSEKKTGNKIEILKKKSKNLKIEHSKKKRKTNKKRIKKSRENLI